MITDRKSYLEYTLSDRKANLKSDSNSIFLWLKNILYPDYMWNFLRLLRRTEYVGNCHKGFFGRISYFYSLYRFRKLSRKLGFSIPLNVFGPGLSLPHYGTIIVNPAVKTGKNCRLHACVNIGASGGSNFAPQIGDNVYIGPGAIIFGDIKIADGVTVGANATVNKSILEINVTVGGTPAKIISENSTYWWRKNGLNL